MLVESSPSSLDDILLIGGGGGGGENGGTFEDGADGGKGGIAAASEIGIGFIGVGQSISDGPDGGSTDGDGIGGSGGSSDADGHDGIGGKGGQGRLSADATWLNGDPGVGSNGKGGNGGNGFDGCGGGGGGASSTDFNEETAGAGGGSWALIPTKTCSTAPNLDSVPSNPGTIRDGESSNGAVEIWIFADGC